MSWKKFDFVFAPNGELNRNYSHATVPTPHVLSDNVVRIFYSSRDSTDKNRVYSVDLEIENDVKVVNRNDTPIIDIGEPGYFDCDGIYATSLVRDEDRLNFYYAGWNAGRDGLFYSSLGLAVSCDNGYTFKKQTITPILARDSVDPWACMAPFVLKLGASEWRMWYTSGIKLWKDASGKLKSLYDIKTANSNDGVNWKKTGKSAIELGDATTNIARACVIMENNRFKAWYPYVDRDRSAYAIGYGESEDGYSFSRKDNSMHAMLNADPKFTWHSHEVTYPHVFKMDGRLFMLFNGNGFGRTGFGVAEWTANE